MRIIGAKSKDKKAVVHAEEEPRQPEVIDLMERLRRSLEANKEAGPKGAKRKTTRKAA